MKFTNCTSKTKKYISFLLVVAIVLGVFFPIPLVEAQGDDIKPSPIFFEVEEITGTSAFSVSDLFNDESTTHERSVKSIPTLTDVEIYLEDGYLIFNSILTDENEAVDMNAYGTVYEMNLGGDLLADMTNHAEGIHIVQFRINENPTSILVVLQREDTEKLMQFNIYIEDYIYEEISNHVRNSLEGQELLDLLSIRNNLITPLQDVDGTFEFTFDMEFDINETEQFGPIQPRRTHSAWRTLLDRLNSGKTAKLSDYDIDASFFKTEGWHYDVQFGTDIPIPYATVIRTIKNGTGEFLIQISMLYYIFNISDCYTEVALQSEYHGGVIVKFDARTGILTPHWQWGHNYTDVEIAIQVWGEENVFVNRSVNMEANAKAKVVRAALVLVPYANDIVDIFNYLSNSGNQTIGNTVMFDENFHIQSEKHNGKVIRGIHATTGNNRLNKAGHFINVMGNINHGNSRRIGFSISASMDIRADF